MMCFLSSSACHESILCQGSIENTGYQLGHPIVSGYLFGYSKKPACLRLSIKLIKAISNQKNKQLK